MTLRRGHGRGAGVPRVEVLPPDELPVGVPAPIAVPDVPLRFREDGRIADSDTAKALGRLGGLAKARTVRLVGSLGLAKLAEGAEFAPYRVAADDFVVCHLEALKAVAGGFDVGPGPSTMVGSAGLQLAASRFCFDRGAAAGDPTLMKLGSQLANDSRQNLLAAYELATREAAARVASSSEPDPWEVSE